MNTITNLKAETAIAFKAIDDVATITTVDRGYHVYVADCKKLISFYPDEKIKKSITNMENWRLDDIIVNLTSIPKNHSFDCIINGKLYENDALRYIHFLYEIQLEAYKNSNKD